MPPTTQNSKGTAKLTSKSMPTTRRSSKAAVSNKPPRIEAIARTKLSPTNALNVGLASPFDIMAARIANRVAEMAENVTFTERTPQPPIASQSPTVQKDIKKKPRKIDLRLADASPENVKFSAPFLDSTLKRMLDLQTRMLKTSNKMATSDADDGLKKESFAQSAELSKIIALICAEKARQGA